MSKKKSSKSDFEILFEEIDYGTGLDPVDADPKAIAELVELRDRYGVDELRTAIARYCNDYYDEYCMFFKGDYFEHLGWECFKLKVVGKIRDIISKPRISDEFRGFLIEKATYMINYRGESLIFKQHPSYFTHLTIDSDLEFGHLEQNLCLTQIKESIETLIPNNHRFRVCFVDMMNRGFGKEYRLECTKELIQIILLEIVDRVNSLAYQIRRIAELCQIAVDEFIDDVVYKYREQDLKKYIQFLKENNYEQSNIKRAID